MSTDDISVTYVTETGAVANDEKNQVELEFELTDRFPGGTFNENFRCVSRMKLGKDQLYAETPKLSKKRFNALRTAAREAVIRKRQGMASSKPACPSSFTVTYTEEEIHITSGKTTFCFRTARGEPGRIRFLRRVGPGVSDELYAVARSKAEKAAVERLLERGTAHKVKERVGI